MSLANYNSLTNNCNVRKLIHDIRSPLALLMILNSAHNQHNIKDQFDHSIQRIKNIIDSAVQSLSDVALKTVAINIHDVIGKIVREKSIEHARTEVAISYIPTENCQNIRIRGDLGNFERMLSNLINNAIEACSPQNGQVQVFLRENNKKITLIINDNGKGIPADILNKINNMESVTYGKQNGNGIGMQQIMQTVRDLNAKLSIVSNVGVGSKFIIEF